MELKEEEIGEIDHYFGKNRVAGIHLKKGRIKLGDRLHIKGHTTDFQETVTSMQVNHTDVREVGSNAHVGVPVHQRTRVHDRVYLVHY